MSARHVIISVSLLACITSQAALADCRQAYGAARDALKSAVDSKDDHIAEGLVIGMSGFALAGWPGLVPGVVYSSVFAWKRKHAAQGVDKSAALADILNELYDDTKTPPSVDQAPRQHFNQFVKEIMERPELPGVTADQIEARLLAENDDPTNPLCLMENGIQKVFDYQSFSDYIVDKLK